MSVFAIGDLHLAGSMDKTMDMFGCQWEDHWNRIRSDWLGRVRETDLVLLPGDISWAMRLEDAQQDLKEIDELPGTKVMVKGNHDYWWGSVTKLRSVLGPSIVPLQNQAFAYDGFVMCGSRGWIVPPEEGLIAQDMKIYQREVARMELSLQAGRKLMENNSKAHLLAMMHFPPFNERQEESGFVRLFKEYGVHKVVYGHLHGKSLAAAFEGKLDGVEYILVSCDHLGFKLRQIF